jgi:hypothetical protein
MTSSSFCSRLRLAAAAPAAAPDAAALMVASLVCIRFHVNTSYNSQYAMQTITSLYDVAIRASIVVYLGWQSECSNTISAIYGNYLPQ